jgi:hypothetical protein
MRICPNCSAENAETWTHCKECGSALSPEAEAEKILLQENVDRQPENQSRGSLYKDFIYSRYRNHYFALLMLLTVWVIFQTALELISGGSLSLMVIAAYFGLALIVVPVMAVVTWLIFKLLRRAIGLEA